MKGVQAAVLGGSALVLLILALRLTLKDHLPRRLFPALWCTAAIRFLLPVEIPTRLSVWNLLRGTAGRGRRNRAGRTLDAVSRLRKGGGEFGLPTGSQCHGLRAGLQGAPLRSGQKIAQPAENLSLIHI